MDNNLKKLAKNLRRFAKNNKRIKYTEGMLIAFLLMGFKGLANTEETTKLIDDQKSKITSTVDSLKKLFSKSKKDNNKLLKSSALDIIQLMEQGDHVVKSPWSSWQFGINMFTEGWSNQYKGKGDKLEKYPYEGVFNRSNNIFERNISKDSTKYSLLSTSSNITSASLNNRQGILNEYGLASTTPVTEPIVDFEINVGVNPKYVDKGVLNVSTLEVIKPEAPTTNIQSSTPKNISIEIGKVEKDVDVVKPNAKPFTQFFFNGNANSIASNNTNTTLYAGLSGNDLLNGTITPAAETGRINEKEISSTSTISSAIPGRPTNILYRSGTNLSNMTFHVRGYFDSDTYTDTGSGKAGGSDPAGGSTAGTIGVHTLLNSNISDVNANLYGRAGFLTSETWRHGKVTMENTNVNVYGKENSVYYIMPAAFRTITKYIDETYHVGALLGTTNVKIYGTDNTVYLSTGISGARRIENDGKIELEGASNIVYSGFGYNPNWQKTSYQNGKTEAMTSAIKLTNTVNLYGDENVGLFFGSKMEGDSAKSWELSDKQVEEAAGYITKASYIGIYQGEIQINAKIGDQLAIDPTATEQTAEGQLTTNSKYTKTTVDGGVGVFATSGQRAGITPTKDLGVPITYSTLDSDTIHNLEIGNPNITFGKYSKNGFMFISKLGTVMDVGKSTTQNYITDATSITDGINGATTTEADAATGTVIAYAEGTWDQSKHQLGSTQTYLNNNNNLAAGSTAASLQGKSSEINLFVPLTMTSKEGIAYFGDNSGIVNAGTLNNFNNGIKVDTVATGHKSIIGFARNNGTVNIYGDIKAQDEGATTNKNQNIGLYSGENGTVNLYGNATINGIGAYSDGNNAITKAFGTNNVINVGESVGIAAQNGGQVEFGGGTINVGTTSEDTSTPFYADENTNSKINFTGQTDIKMTKGNLIVENESNYGAASGLATKYNGMSNVDIDLSGTAKVIKNSDGETVTWTGTTNVLNSLKNDMKVNSLTGVTKDNLSLYYMNGQMDIATDVNLSDPNDLFNTVGFSKELITINSGVEITSTDGTGLEVASNDTATSNRESGYINNGLVSINGGNKNSTTAINTSYGMIQNNNKINVDNGTAMYGTNGSYLENSSTGEITILNEGYGIVGMSTGSILQNYGTDAGAIGKKVEIINNGLINILGDNSIGIYAENNNGALQSEVTVENSGKINVGNIGVGIVLKGTNGGELTLLGTGDSDIITGNKGIGIYAENSLVNMNSDYGIETKDGGIGIYLTGTSTMPTSNTLNYEYNGSSTGQGIGIVNNVNNSVNNTNVNILNVGNTTGGLIGIFANGGGTFINNGEIKGTSTANEIGIVGENTNIVNTGKITLGNANSINSPNVAIFTKTNNSITNSGNLTLGNNGLGIYGYEVTNSGDITVGNTGIGIYSQGGNINQNGGIITVGTDKAAGIYLTGTGQSVLNNANNINIGDGSYGIVNVGTGNTITSNTNDVKLGNDAIFIYSKDKTGNIINNTNIESTGLIGENYGIYSAGTVINNGNINFEKGVGNVGIYSIDGGIATNNGIITVGLSDADNDKYGIGMAAGYSGTNGTPTTGNIINAGTINVNGENSVGMYGTGIGSTIKNSGTITLNKDNTVGIYADEGVIVENSGVITTGISNLKNITGIYLNKNATLNNTGKIIIDATSGRGIYSKGGIIQNYGTIIATNGAKAVHEFNNKPTTKSVAGVKIDAPAGATDGKILFDGVEVTPTLVTTTQENKVDIPVDSIGLYVNTSGTVYTNPIDNVGLLTDEVDLIIGAEAAENTNSKAIKINDPNILTPYNKSMLNNPQVTKWSVYSGSLTWMASVTLDKTSGEINNILMAKIPYTAWSGNAATPVNASDTYNFTDGLEQRYGVDWYGDRGAREKELFNKLNSIGNNEEILLYQAFDEMMGHQYGNVQQRTVATNRLLTKEIDHLMDDWRNPSKENNKVKLFGMRSNYKTDTAGIIDYSSDSYGVAYVHEDETLRLSDSSGWYAGYVYNRNKFKDIGGSRENTHMLKAGIFKSMTPSNDYNGSLKWTIAGEGYVAQNEMKRRFLVVDEIFGAESDYYTYGVALKNDISKTFRTSERTKLKAYGSLDLEYGRFSTIKEDTGEIRLEIEGNDYYSIRPEVGLEFKYSQPMAKSTLLTTSLGVAYENELGKVNDVNNRGRVRYTTADWFGIRSEKEDRRGNVKTDLKLGIDNQRVGFTLNLGYDTKGQNLRGGIGIRAIY